MLLLVTTSKCLDWVIYAPAAFLGCGSRFSAESDVSPSEGKSPWSSPLPRYRKIPLTTRARLSPGGRLYLKRSYTPTAI